MEITGWTIYWLTRLDALHGTLFFVALGVSLLSFFALAFGTLEQKAKDNYPSLYSEEVRKSYRAQTAVARRLGARGLIVGLCAFFVVGFIPTTKEAAAILVIPALANNEDVQGLGEDFVNLAREWMQELRPKDEAQR